MGFIDVCLIVLSCEGRFFWCSTPVSRVTMQSPPHRKETSAELVFAGTVTPGEALTTAASVVRTGALSFPQTAPVTVYEFHILPLSRF